MAEKIKHKRERNPNKKPYVTNAQLMEAFYESKEAGDLQPQLAKYICQLAERYSLSPNFIGYSFREDMVAEAICTLFQGWHKFNPEYYSSLGKEPNIFAYYTQACYHSFLKVLGEEKKQRQIRDELLVEAGKTASFGHQMSSRPSSSDDTSFNSSSS